MTTIMWWYKKFVSHQIYQGTLRVHLVCLQSSATYSYHVKNYHQNIWRVTFSKSPRLFKLFSLQKIPPDFSRFSKPKTTIEILYKDIEAEACQKSKNILRIFWDLSSNQYQKYFNLHILFMVELLITTDGFKQINEWVEMSMPPFYCSYSYFWHEEANFSRNMLRIFEVNFPEK